MCAQPGHCRRGSLHALSAAELAPLTLRRDVPLLCAGKRRLRAAAGVMDTPCHARLAMAPGNSMWWACPLASTWQHALLCCWPLMSAKTASSRWCAVARPYGIHDAQAQQASSSKPGGLALYCRPFPSRSPSNAGSCLSFHSPAPARFASNACPETLLCKQHVKKVAFTSSLPMLTGRPLHQRP
jgi:hypothetical protein